MYTPPGQTQPTPPGQTPPRQTPPGRHPPLGRHPTGMHSDLVFTYNFFNTVNIGIKELSVGQYIATHRSYVALQWPQSSVLTPDHEEPESGCHGISLLNRSLEMHSPQSVQEIVFSAMLIGRRVDLFGRVQRKAQKRSDMRYSVHDLYFGGGGGVKQENKPMFYSTVVYVCFTPSICFTSPTHPKRNWEETGR